MKKFYVSIVVCFGLFIQGYGQDYTWIGGASGNWSDDANWSGTGYPDSDGDNVIFDQSVSVTIDAIVGDDPLGDILLLNSLLITNSATVNIITPAGIDKTVMIQGASPSTFALKIDALAALNLNTGASSLLTFIVAENSTSFINGILSLDGADNLDFFSTFFIEGTESSTTKVYVSESGSLITKKTGLSIYVDVDELLEFQAGSELNFQGINVIVPSAIYDPSSEIIITGVINTPIAFQEVDGVGNLTYNCAAQSGLINLSIPDNFVVAGSLNILNTNGNTLVLMNNVPNPTSSTNLDFTINGNLNIESNCKVAISSSNSNVQNYLATIGGNLMVGGNEFSLQSSVLETYTGITTLAVKGNIQHTAGSFTVLCANTNETTSLYNIEMIGGGSQTISSTAGILDNNAHQITLRINKPSSTGTVTLLTPAAVGRLNLTSGKLITSAVNNLTIRNTSGESIVLSSSPNSFLEGTLRRTAIASGDLVFPTGTGTSKRELVLNFENTPVQSVFEVTIKNGSSPITYAAPLEGIEQNYYWEVNRVSGAANAKVKLSLSGGVAGADAGDAIVVAKYDGSNWVRARGISGGFINPGDLLTGTAQTDEQTSFGLYTFGYGAQAAVLPIKLESFNAKKVNSSAQINWRISENSNPVSFEVMKSGDGINFSKLGTVTAFDGKLNYDFTDNTLLTGNNYYRLRMLDKDGIVSFSSIVVVMNGTKGVMISSMIPTMVVDRARLNITSSVNGNIQLVITDISGRVIQIQNASIISGNQEIWLNASRLSSGIFQVTGYMNGEKTATIRFFKR